MNAPKNVLVAQPGGPSPVINNSLRGTAEYPAAPGIPYGQEVRLVV